ncbi:MAG: RNA polymerase sigma factor [Bacteroidota bacterium]|jgi:RNA polymerase sigma factor (sigma-70 family)
MTEKHYNELVNLHADNVFRFVVKNIRHTEDARDIVQTAYEKLWVNREKIDPVRAKSWLFTVAYHALIDYHRRSGRVNYSEQLPEQETATLYVNKALQEQLHAALSQLNEVQRSLVLLKDYEGYSYEEIGQITGLQESQVKVYLHRARQKLRTILVSSEQLFDR